MPFSAKTYRKYCLALLCTVIIPVTFAESEQQSKSLEEPTISEQQSKSFKEPTIFQLDNGLTVALTYNPESPTIATRIAVKAGSCDDPSDRTGLAHYLEHLLFKGSQNLGTTDFAEEEKLLAEINALYEKHASTDDPETRLEIYREIDRLSGEAATKYAIPSEYSTVMRSLGASNVNAYTSIDRTVFLATIPSNQLEKWLKLELDRFQDPVFRLFHTELETVYEEYNMYQDKPARRRWAAMQKALFGDDPLGRPVIGLPEHLKNPLPSSVMEFYRKHYVPGNMIIALSGDLDIARTRELLENTFGTLPAGEIPEKAPATFPVMDGEKKIEMTAPTNDEVTISYRIDNPDQHTQDLLVMTDAMMCNGSAGIIDQEITLKRQATHGYSYYTITPGKAAVFNVGGTTLPGQTPEELQKILENTISQLCEGNFSDELPSISTDHFELDWILQSKDNSFRVEELVDAFISDEDWQTRCGKFDRYRNITKEDIVDFAKKFFATENRLITITRNGELEKMPHLEKPPITALNFAADRQSHFASELMSVPVKEIEPAFPDLANSIRRESIPFPVSDGSARNITVESVDNLENDYFQLKFIFDKGYLDDKLLMLATAYVQFAGTEAHSAAEMNMDLYKLTGSIALSVDSDITTLTISGLHKNSSEILTLAAEHLRQPAPDQQDSFNTMLDILERQRQVDREKPETLMNALVSYVLWGKHSPLLEQLPMETMRKLPLSAMRETLQKLLSAPVRVQYFGPRDKELAQQLQLEPQQEPAHNIRSEITGNERKVWFIHVPNLSQSTLCFIGKRGQFTPDNIGERFLFNSCFGSGLGNITYRTFREERSLCYSCSAAYSTPDRPEEYFHYALSIGTQNDKIPEVIQVAETLTLDISEEEFANHRQRLLKTLASERWNDENLLSLAEEYRHMRLPDNFREVTYRAVESCTLEELLDFYHNEVRQLPENLIVIGDENAIDMTALEQFGPVEKITAEEIMPF